LKARVWVDGQCLQTGSRVRGIGRYVRDYLIALGARDEFELVIAFNANQAVEAERARCWVAANIPDATSIVWQPLAVEAENVAPKSIPRRASEIVLQHHIAAIAPDLVLLASPFEGLDDGSIALSDFELIDCPVAAIFYDAIPLRYAKHYLSSPDKKSVYKRRLKLLKKADLLLTISDFVQDEANKLIPGVKAVPMYAGLSSSILNALQDPPPVEDQLEDPAENPAEKNTEADELTETDTDSTVVEKALAKLPAVFYVGGYDWRKNVEVIVDALGILAKRGGSRVRFVAAGYCEADDLAALQKRWVAHDLDESLFEHLGIITDAELTALYRSSSLVVQPSKMEGFGLTALEAMVVGAPVIGARAGAIPEVVGNDSALFNPDDPAELADMIRRSLEDSDFCDRLRGDPEVLREKYNWTRVAEISATAFAGLLEVQQRARPSLGDMRERTKALLGDKARRLRGLAPALAFAEPALPGEQRLIIDVSNTARTDYVSGIQRVVSKLATNLVPVPRTPSRDSEQVDKKDRTPAALRAGMEIKLADCIDVQGFYWAGYDPKKKIVASQRTEAGRVQFGADDTVLMLDSSWGYHEAHLKVLRQARLLGADVVTTLYDLVPLETPAFCDPAMPVIFSQWLGAALEYSTSFVCISRDVADRLIRLLHAIKHPRPLNIGYWRLGADVMQSANPATGKTVGPQEAKVGMPSFLCVGTIEPRKGHRLVLRAFEQLWARGVDARLVFVGRRGWSVGSLADAILHHPEFGKRLVWLARASDEELLQQYDNCDALIAASFAEGFGLPIVEAGMFGKPIIASDIPVFREVTSKSSSARFFETGSSEALASAIEEMIATPATHSRPAEPWPNWQQSADELFALVSGDEWYYEYRPDSVELEALEPGSAPAAMRKKIGKKHRQHALRQMGEFELSDDGEQWLATIEFSNCSKRVWSSWNGGSAWLGVFLGYHLYLGNGEPLGSENPRSAIPFALAPGDSLLMAISIPANVMAKGVTHVEIEVLQEGVDWWGKPLRLRLPDAVY